ncbi:MAG TPA: YtxH domain-containing protein [Thermodesulfobacteriota bacterium]|nr:YtxH domain-containing protein [Thermodesulfobacteriota bacterium]
MENESNGSKGSSLAVSFTAGGVIGAALALLYAPWEGRQARSKLKEIAGEVKEKANVYAVNLKGRASNLMGKKTPECEETGETAYKKSVEGVEQVND